MNALACPYCPRLSNKPAFRPKSRYIGTYRRKSDRKVIRRLLCTGCGKTFSRENANPCRFQNKRHLNSDIELLLCSGVSLRRAALVLNISRTTVARKLIFLGSQARLVNERSSRELQGLQNIQFDDLETSEHTKCKPLSVTLAVEERTRRILGFEVAPMPAKGRIAYIARKRYGPRLDLRSPARIRLFNKLKSSVACSAEFLSDENPHYSRDLRAIFPKCTHKTTKGRRGCVVGQGELKRGGFDPLFSLNHTCAMLRANINRLFRRTWCTTKKQERLVDHLNLYMRFHNQVLI